MNVTFGAWNTATGEYVISSVMSATDYFNNIDSSFQCYAYVIGDNTTVTYSIYYGANTDVS